MSGAEKKLIVIADDERDIAEIISEVLEAEGYRTVRAYDGEQALQEIRRLRPHAAVLDIKMPGLDGLEVIRRLRQDPALQTLPVVVVTATRIIQDLKDRLAQLKIHSWMTKPFEPDQMLAAVKKALGE